MPKKFRSHEQIAAETLERDLKRLREGFRISEPSITYKVGDRVQHGRIKQSNITEIIDNGKILKLHQIVTENNYGRPYDYERELYVYWFNVTPYRTSEENALIPSFLRKEDIKLNFSQRNMSAIFIMAYTFGLNMDPDYQRGDVWELKDKQALIDSIFNNVDIGKFVFIHLDYNSEPSSPLYEVLDGKQRVTTIIEFFENRFTYNGRLYHELSNQDQGHFEDYHIAVAEIKDITLKQKLDYFLRLNTHGKPQDPEHMKKIESMYKSL